MSNFSLVTLVRAYDRARRRLDKDQQEAWDFIVATCKEHRAVTGSPRKQGSFNTWELVENDGEIPKYSFSGVERGEALTWTRNNHTVPSGHVAPYLPEVGDELLRRELAARRRLGTVERLRRAIQRKLRIGDKSDPVLSACEAVRQIMGEPQ